jgi:hypothetical protein
VLDSLNSYEFLKARTGQLRSDLQVSQTEKFTLKIQLVRANVRADSTGRAAGTTAAKLKASRTENWVWRGFGFLTFLELTASILKVF